MTHNLHGTLQTLATESGVSGTLLLAARARGGRRRQGLAPAGLDPHRARERAAQLRRQEGHRRARARSSPTGRRTAARTEEIPFVVARVVLQDFTGVPLLCDLAAMRGVAQRLGKDPEGHRAAGAGRPGRRPLGAGRLLRHAERARPQHEARVQAQRRALPVHEMGHAGVRHVQGRAARASASCTRSISSTSRAACYEKDGVYYPDTLVGTDSHTTMINGIGVVGWGVGGIEAEAGMLGQPVYFLTPDVVGVHLTGALREGVTATDLVLTVTELLRKEKVVGKFVEYFGEGAASLAGARSRDDRATWRPSTARRWASSPSTRRRSNT